LAGLPAWREENYSGILFIGEDVFELGDEGREVFFDGAPHHVEVDIVICVDKAIPHSDNTFPGDQRKLVFACLRYVGCCFSYDLD